ncbi:MAG TPA: hypothetical protein VG962_02305 [Steroidobacteraceae bacterium]|nr:hypothetical protein [Steroidobacteraceae bacterium]
MMATTSLKLSDQLKKRTTQAAKRMGMSTHAFMVEAIEKAAVAAELRGKLVADAEAARKSTLETGKGYDADEVHAWLRKRVQGKKAARPKAVSWRS